VTAEPTSDTATTTQTGARAWISEWWKGVRRGELGSLPIIVGLVIIAVIFGSVSPVFFSPRNFVNLALQIAGITTIAIGVVWVLLIGEIDLSVGFVSGVGGVVTAMLLLPPSPGLPWPIAIGIALAITAAIGVTQGLIITKFGVPSFVVTLAGLLIWSGVVLILTTIVSKNGSIGIQDLVVIGIAGSFLPATLSWILVGLLVGAYAVAQVVEVRSKRANGLPARPWAIVTVQVAILALISFTAVWYFNLDRGVPSVSVLLGVLLIFWTIVASRTRFGRYVYAIGGSAEAARRAGIRVDRIRVLVFMICSLMAGLGGIVLASRLRSVDTGTGGGNLLLNAIAAAVIGGTSLFGGQGRIVSALLGALVIGSVENGMGLLGLPSGVKFVITGLVLLAAVLLDAVAKRRRAATGSV
jgi:D-xylose transport system permease protein